MLGFFLFRFVFWGFFCVVDFAGEDAGIAAGKIPAQNFRTGMEEIPENSSGGFLPPRGFWDLRNLQIQRDFFFGNFIF